MSAKDNKEHRKSISSKRTRLQEHRVNKRQQKRRKDINKADSVAREKKDKEKQLEKPVTGWRLWLFRLIAVTLIPAAVFLFVELALRIAGYGYRPTATIKSKIGGKAAYGDNERFNWRFFPPNIARASDPFVFLAEKPEFTYRIFVMGASAAQGMPDGAFSFGRFLKVMLQEQYPTVNFEVINTATAAINSHVVVEIAKDCAKHQPDLFVVYLGNNEVVGPYGAGTVFAPLSPHLGLIRAGIYLKGTKLGQLLTNLISLAGPKRTKTRVWGGLEMFLEEQVRLDDPRLQIVYRHFESNLETIVELGRKNGAQVICCTVASNLKDNPPFASMHRPGLSQGEQEKWNGLYQEGISYEQAGQYDQAVERYLSAGAIDDSYAELCFRLGRCYWQLGQYDKARQSYIKAREQDTLRFRADSRVNEIIRAAGAGRAGDGVYVVDAEAAFSDNSPHKTAGYEFFYEHVHLNLKGNYLLAKTIYKQVEAILPGWVKSRKDNFRLFPDRAYCIKLLAYTYWDKYKITKNITGLVQKPPFINQLYNKQRVQQMKSKLKAIEDDLTDDNIEKAKLQYQRAIERDGQGWWFRRKYAQLLTEKLRDYPAAAKQYEALMEYYGHSHIPHAELGFLQIQQGNFSAGIVNDLKAIEIQPADPLLHHHLGFAYQMQGMIDKAIEHYSTSVRLQPNYIPVYIKLVKLLYNQGKIDEAVKVYRTAIANVPDSAILHHSLGVLLARQGRRDEAIKQLRKALELEPKSIETKKALEQLLQQR